MNRQRASIDVILSTAAELSGVAVWEIYSGCRNRQVIQARQSAIWMLRHHRGMSYPEIADILGTSHSAVIEACQRVEQCLKERWGCAGKAKRRETAA